MSLAFNFLLRGWGKWSKGAIFVVDSSNRRIQDLAPRGPIRAIAAPGPKPNGKSLPYAVAMDSTGVLYVTDSAANHIIKLAPNGRLLATIGATGTMLGQLDDRDILI